MTNFNFLSKFNNWLGELSSRMSLVGVSCEVGKGKMSTSCPRYLFRKVFVLCMLLGIVGVGNAWGTEVSVSISTYASANSWTNDSKYGSVTIDANVTATTTTGSNNGKYWSNDDSWRFYHSESGKLTISTSSGTLNSVTLTFTTKDNGKISYGSTALTSGVAQTVSGTSAEFVVGSTKDSKGKIFITAISVTYTPAAGSTKTLV